MKRQLVYTIDTELPIQHLSVSTGMYLFPAKIQGCPKVFMMSSAFPLKLEIQIAAGFELFLSLYKIQHQNSPFVRTSPKIALLIKWEQNRTFFFALKQLFSKEWHQNRASQRVTDDQMVLLGKPFWNKYTFQGLSLKSIEQYRTVQKLHIYIIHLVFSHFPKVSSRSLRE